jgi:hypothetical protein
MNDPQPETTPWIKIFIESVGFIWGFVLGGLTGVFGNWLYDKIKSWRRKTPQLSVSTTPSGTYFEGTAVQGNKIQTLETLCKAIPDPRNKVIQITVSEKNTARTASSVGP